MTDGSEQPQWRYEFKKNDPESAKAAYKELLEDDDDPLTLIDIEDDYSSTICGVVVYRNENEEFIPSTGEIQIDYEKNQLTVPEELRDIHGLEKTEVPATDVRYVGIPQTGRNAGENDGSVVVLSVWTRDRAIENVYIIYSDTKQSVSFLNAMSRLIFESFGQSSARTHKFYTICEGLVDVAWCTAEERDARDAWKQKNEAANKNKSTAKKSSLETDAADESGEKKEQEEYPALKRSPMYVTVDEEAILLFNHLFSSTPLHDFRFYREPTKRSIDTIYVCNTEDQLEIQQGDNVFFIHPRSESETSSKCFGELVRILRDGTVKPKTETAFTGSGGAFSKIFTTDDRFSDDLDEIVPSSRSVRRTDERAQYGQSNASNMPYGQSNSWLSNLNSGAHLLNVSEEMQMMWFSVEPELELLIASGAVPESDMQSSGLDPNSADHLQTAVESIRDKLLLPDSHGEAVSQLRGILKLYGGTLLVGAVVDGISEVDLLKRIYFLA